MLEDTDGLRLIRYLAGECSPSEAAEIRDWIAADPMRAQAADEFAQVWQASARPPMAADVDAAWQELVHARETQRVRPLHSSTVEQGWAAPAEHRTPSRQKFMWWTKIAAAIVLAVSGGTLWFLTTHGVAERSGRTDVVLADSVQTYATRRGERAEFRLADGSRVRLGVDSKLWVPVSFGRATRAVRLTGEAYFEVVHDTARPFVVHASGTTTEDLGTIFGVRAYPGDPVRVVVAEGAVAVRDTRSRAAAALAERDLAMVGMDGRVRVERDVDPKEYLAWTSGQLVFQNTPFGDVVKDVERWFDVRLVVEDSKLLAAKVTVTFGDDRLDDVLYVLARTLDATIERRDGVVFVRRRT